MKLRLIPFLCADQLPDDLLEYCLDREWPTHYSSGVVEVDLDSENPMSIWLKSQGYEFSPKEIKRGWGHVAILGS